MSGLRGLDPALAEEIEQPQLRPFLGLHIALDDPVFAVTGNATVRFAGEEWSAIGGLGQIDIIGEGSDGAATGVRATLSMIPAELSEHVVDQAESGRLLELHVGALNASYTDVIGTKVIWKGRLDTYELTDAGDTLTVSVTGESRMIDQRRPTIKRFTDAWQRRRFAGDRAFEFVGRMIEVPILWARARQDPVL